MGLARCFILLVFTFFITNKLIGQIDTTKTIYKNLKTKNCYASIIMRETTKDKLKEYTINERKVTKKEYNDFEKSWNNFESCTPCILKSYDENNLLLNEAVFYTDCYVGHFIEYYPSGKIKKNGHYKENNTGSWNTNNKWPCSEKHGSWSLYDETGKILNTEFYRNDSLINH